MTTWEAVGIFLVLVTGMVFLSGCTGLDSTNATPETPLTRVIVHDPALETVTLTPETTLPPSVPTAIPTSVPTTPPTTPPTSIPTPLVTSVPTALPTSVPTTDDTSGSLFIHVLAGGCGGDLKVFIARDGTDVSPPVYYYLPDRTVIEGPNPGYIPVKILMDGNSYRVNFPSGTFTAYLPDMKGGVPEQQSFVLSPGGRTDIWFSGTLSTASARGCS